MLADLLSESYAAVFDDCLERERTETPVRAFAVRLYAIGCSLRETRAIRRSLGAERFHQAIWHWVHRLADSVPNPPTSTRASLSCGPSEHLMF